MQQSLCKVTEGNTPLVAAAIHDGHEVRDEVAAILALDKHDRFREEDPFTRTWTVVADTRIVGLRSRFEVDLNRPREKAIYRSPEEAWGLKVWKTQPSAEIINRSLAEYDAFYARAYNLFASLEQRFGYFVVFDFHTYNHRRERPNAPPANPLENPEVNVGTGSLNRQHWAPLVDRFITDLSCFNFLGRRLDVRENVKFQGGHFQHWIHRMFPKSACVVSIEFKKFFMNEWSYEADHRQLKAIYYALRSTIPGIFAELNHLEASRQYQYSRQFAAF